MHSKYRRYIINDFKLPKIVTLSPYFEDQYELLKDYGFEEAFIHVNSLIDDFHGSPSLFFEEVNTLSNKLHHDVYDMYQDSFDKWRSVYDVESFHNYRPRYRKYVDNDSVVGGKFIRIDIVKACFNVLSHLTDEMNYHTFDCFVNSHTEYDEQICEYVSSSKRIRNYIFGSIQKELITHLEKHVLGSLMEEIDLPVMFKGMDEILFEYSDEAFEKVQRVLSHSDFIDILKVEVFEVEGLDIGIAEVFEDEVVFKGAPADYFCEVYAKYYNLPIVSNFRVFNHHDQPCMRL